MDTAQRSRGWRRGEHPLAQRDEARQRRQVGTDDHRAAGRAGAGHDARRRRARPGRTRGHTPRARSRRRSTDGGRGQLRTRRGRPRNRRRDRRVPGRTRTSSRWRPWQTRYWRISPCAGVVAPYKSRIPQSTSARSAVYTRFIAWNVRIGSLKTKSYAAWFVRRTRGRMRALSLPRYSASDHHARVDRAVEAVSLVVGDPPALGHDRDHQHHRERGHARVGQPSPRCAGVRRGNGAVPHITCGRPGAIAPRANPTRTAPARSRARRDQCAASAPCPADGRTG